MKKTLIVGALLGALLGTPKLAKAADCCCHPTHHAVTHVVHHVASNVVHQNIAVAVEEDMVQPVWWHHGYGGGWGYRHYGYYPGPWGYHRHWGPYGYGPRYYAPPPPPVYYPPY